MFLLFLQNTEYLFYMGKILKNLSVDCTIFGFEDDVIKLLLIKRKDSYIDEEWALPGGNIRSDEGVNSAALRILEEMSGVTNVYMDQVYVFGEPDRVKGRIVTVAYYALVNPKKYLLKPNIPGALEARWFNLKNIPQVALDHKEIIETSFKKLKRRFRFEPIGYELLPEKFTLRELQNLYEQIYEIKLDNRNFRKKILSTRILLELDGHQEKVSHRPAKLYKFDAEIYETYKKQGINLDILPSWYVNY
jgi:8-oxo-dGTP diphosphatase